MFYCTRVLEILNFVGSLANKIVFVIMIRWVSEGLYLKLGGYWLKLSWTSLQSLRGISIKGVVSLKFGRSSFKEKEILLR